MVFQSYALYPHITVGANIALPLVMSRLRLWERLPLVGLLSRRRRSIRLEIEDEVRAVARQLHIDSLLARRPAQLSGGQRQRVALGRAMVRRPDVFLMDEPLSNLDAKLRVHMRSELADLHARLGATFVYVTHDQVEAMTMSDRIAMMDSGQILQLGTPSELYERPVSVKVAAFIGSPAINLLPARVHERGAVEILDQRLPLTVGLAPGSRLTIGLRPEAIGLDIAQAASEGCLKIPAMLHRKENLGPEFILHLEALGPEATSIVARVPAGPDLPAPQSPVTLRCMIIDCHVFDESGKRIEAKPAGDHERERRVRSAALSGRMPA
jgi:multiple sugar transport system ATP-binding protein